MKISELIARLSEIQSLAGDMPVWISEMSGETERIVLGPLSSFTIHLGEDIVDDPDNMSDKYDPEPGKPVLLLGEDFVSGASLLDFIPATTYAAVPGLAELVSGGLVGNVDDYDWSITGREGDAPAGYDLNDDSTSPDEVTSDGSSN